MDRADVMNRIRSESPERYQEATEFRREEIKRLRADGLKQAEARELAWQAMADKFPPITVQAPHSASSDSPIGLARREPICATCVFDDWLDKYLPNPSIEAVEALEAIAEDFAEQATQYGQ